MTRFLTQPGNGEYDNTMECRCFECGEGLSIPVYGFDVLDSTSDEARPRLASGEYVPFAVTAVKQTAGRGRRGKSFHSPEGGVYLSLVLPLPGDGSIPLLTPMAAVAIRRAILAVTGRETGINWVNDLFFDGRKVCGILA